MVSTVNALLMVGILAGGVLYWFGYQAYRLSARLGRQPFIAFVSILGTGCVAVGVAGLVPSVLPIGPEGSAWEDLPTVFWILTTFPWFVFAVKYSGTRAWISRRSLLALSLPYLLIITNLLTRIFDIEYVSVLNTFGSVVFIYILVLTVGGAFLLMQSTYSYGHTTVWQGVSLAAIVLGSLVIWNFTSLQATEQLGKAGTYAAGATVAAAGVGAAWHRYALFEASPSVGTLGEQALTGETEDLMFVVDSADRVITLNDTATDTLSITQSGAQGSPIQDMLGQSSEQLRQAETVTLLTADGTRQYDPQVSQIDDGHDNAIGATLSLRDVTERNRRKQRLAVLNRILRHNLRNKVDVVKGHAETLAESDADVTPIIDAADEIASLGQHARQIDQYVSAAGENVAVDLDEAVRSVLDTIETNGTGVTVTVEPLTSATVRTNRRALTGGLEVVLENAVEYAESTVSVDIETDPDGYVIRVVDDGPGIPDWELESLDAGTESPLQHSTGLGLWQVKWAVTALDGDLSFDTNDGTTVEIFIPDSAGDKTAS